MRSIKFRAWDEVKKVMIPSVGFTDNDIGRVWIRERYMVDDGSNSASPDWIPMQYTGITDKNCKEIWEGDIVSSKNRNYEIRWVVDGWAVVNEKAGISNALRLWLHSVPCEVIGNIYENPDLTAE